MVEVIINEGNLILNIPWIKDDFVKPLIFPLAHVIGVEIDISLARSWLIRFNSLSAAMPGLARKGVYYEDGNYVYWEIDNPARAIVISLRNERYEKLIVGVENPFLAVAMIENSFRDDEPEPNDLAEEQEADIVRENSHE